MYRSAAWYRPTMQYLLLGCLGALSFELLDLVSAVQRAGAWPWKIRGEPGLLAYAVATVLRVAIGGSIALVFGASGQISGLTAAFALGVGGVLVMERLARLASFSAPSDVKTPSSNPFRAGDEPPHARVQLPSQSAAIIAVLTDPDIPEAIASDVGMSVSDVNKSLTYMMRRGYVEPSPEGDQGFRLTHSGEIIRRRLAQGDPRVVVVQEESDSHGNIGSNDNLPDNRPSPEGR